MALIASSPSPQIAGAPSDPPSLIGLSRAELGAALAGVGVARAARSGCACAAVALALCARRHRFRGDDQHRARSCAPKLADTFTLAAAGDRQRAGLRRRHAQMAVPLPAARRRPAGRDRDRLHPRGGPRHALPLEPGRLHADLLLLPHRHAEAGAQPHRRGDRRRRSWSPATGSATSRTRDTPTGAMVPARGAAGLQRRDDGDGRAALQFRQCQARRC